MTIRLCVILRGSESKNFTIEPIQSNLGAFVEEIADLRLFNTEWKVVTKIDLNFFTLEYFNIKDMTTLLEKRCEKFNNYLKLNFNTQDWSYSFFCSLPRDNINILMQEIEENSHQWFIDNNPQVRHKRSIFSALGGVLLGAAGYGFLSDNNAEFYMEEFNKLKEMDKTQNIYMQKQTILIESIFQQLNHSEQNLENMKTQINTVFTNLQEYVSQAQKEFHISNQHIHLLHIQSDINALMDNFILMLMRFLFKQKQFLEAVAITHKNPSNPNLIPPQTLFNALTELKN